jgi:lipoate synthase
MTMTNTQETDLSVKARELHATRECPNCHRRFSLWEAVAMISGDGCSPHVRVRLRDSSELIVPIEVVNPQTMQIMED